MPYLQGVFVSYFDDNQDYIIYGRGRGRRDPEPREAPTCNRCGTPGLNWQHDGDRWVLHEGRHRVHKCPTTNPADDFEVLE